ncbi:hypothetical protein JCM11251_003359 [Rhodosporidiobolus azoricus]
MSSSAASASGAFPWRRPIFTTSASSSSSSDEAHERLEEEVDLLDPQNDPRGESIRLRALGTSLQGRGEARREGRRQEWLMRSRGKKHGGDGKEVHLSKKQRSWCIGITLLLIILLGGLSVWKFGEWWVDLYDETVDFVTFPEVTTPPDWSKLAMSVFDEATEPVVGAFSTATAAVAGAAETAVEGVKEVTTCPTARSLHELPPALSRARSSLSPADGSNASPASRTTTLKVHRRGRDGCLSCRQRKKKCGLERPCCKACVRLELECEWEGPQHEEERKRRRLERREEREKSEKERRELVKLGEEARRKQQQEETATLAVQSTGTREWAEALPIATPGTGADGKTSFENGTAYDPTLPALFPPYSAAAPFQPAMPFLLPPSSSSWVPFLGSLAPTPAFPSSVDAPTAWSTFFPELMQSELQSPVPIQPVGLAGAQLASTAEEVNLPSASAGATLRHHSPSPGLDWMTLLRSPSPPAISSLPFYPTHPTSVFHGLSSLTPPAIPPKAPSPRLPPPAAPQTAIITRATSLLVSADFEFTKAYLLSHYATSLAKGVSLASSDASSRPSTPSGGRPSSSASASATKCANLFLGLIPLAHRHTYVLNAILSWSAANLAVSSSGMGSGTPSSAGAATEGNSVMSSLSDELGGLAQQELEEALPALEERFRQLRLGRSTSFAARCSSTSAATVPAAEWEPTLAAWVMLVQASICRGDTAIWRLRLRQAANVVSLVGGVGQACKTPLARQLVRNLLYHEVLSKGPGAEEGLLLDYSGLSESGGVRRKGSNPPPDMGEMASSNMEGSAADEMEEAGEASRESGALLTATSGVFLLIGRITSVVKQKRTAVQQSGDGVAEDELASLLRSVEEVKTELEEEEKRIDVMILESPDLVPHRYYHEVFRLAALAFLHMVLEVPPRALPMVMLVRKMLSLTEAIVAENLPGLCSMHWCLFIMQLNSTPLVSPHSSFGSDRDRSSRLFDAQMAQFRFLNTRKSRQLVEEAWRRSDDGRCFVDPDDILAEWKWDLNLA